MLPFAVIRRGAVMACLEYAVKGGEAVKAALHRDIRNGVLRIVKQQLCVEQPPFCQVFIVGYAGKLLEQPDKVRLAKACHIRELI